MADPVQFPEELYTLGWRADGHSRRYGDSRQKYQSDKGPRTYRRTLSRTPEMVSISTGRLMTPDQAARFDRFWVEDTSYGSWLFWMRDPVRWGQPTGLLTEDGEPILAEAWWLCQFADEPPTEVPVNSGYRVSFQLLKLPR